MVTLCGSGVGNRRRIIRRLFQFRVCTRLLNSFHPLSNGACAMIFNINSFSRILA